MAAERLIDIKEVFADGAIMQITVWQVPEPVPPSRHRFKYSLFYGYPGRRIVAFDNERGKGDHRHLDEVEVDYAFTTIRALLADFAVEVRKAGGPI
jgi:hypothetical protein